jgi:uncharacterized membrane protein
LSEDSPAAIPTIRIRIETLSDLVFGLALSIGSINLIEHIPQDATGLITDVGLFAFSFLIIVGIWLGYTRIIAVLPVETASTLSLNLGLLFCVALEPFFFYVYQTAPAAFLDFSSAAYALDTGSMMALLAGMMFLVIRQDSRREVRRLRQVSIRNFRVSMVSQAIGSGLFIISASDVFWVVVPDFGYLRFLIWYIALGTFFASRALSGSRTGRHNNPRVLKEPPRSSIYGDDPDNI